MNIDNIEKRAVALLEELQKIESTRKDDGVNQFQIMTLSSQISNLIHSTTGPKSSYAESLREAMKHKITLNRYLAVGGVIQAFYFDLSKGHLINIRQEIEAVVVSEILTQARKLLKNKDIHPAASIVVACAAIEEFLRNWCELKNINVPEKQRSLAKFSQELRKSEQISLPVERRIQSWADYRNEAAHGSKWENITKPIATSLVDEIENFIIENNQILGA